MMRLLQPQGGVRQVPQITHRDLVSFADDKINLKQTEVDDQRAQVNRLRRNSRRCTWCRAGPRRPCTSGQARKFVGGLREAVARGSAGLAIRGMRLAGLGPSRGEDVGGPGLGSQGVKCLRYAAFFVAEVGFEDCREPVEFS